ncbi:MAG TPA: hypothetical protein VLF71_02000 [Candidatus Saccharimonadales bacterium]|nr:hypothetical protein [Candidatus Saccharimonadales bacterium]
MSFPLGGNLPPDPFAQAPSPDGLFVELVGGMPGPAADFAAAAHGAAATNFEYTIPGTGELHLCAPDGTQVELTAREVHSSGLAGEVEVAAHPSLARLAGDGLARLFAGKFQGAATDYTARITSPGGQTVTLQARRNQGHIAAGVWTDVETSEGPAPVEVADPAAIEAALTAAAETIRSGTPIDPQLIIAERQKGPCEQIVGAEAVEVQAAALRLLGKDRRPGKPQAKGYRRFYEPAEPDPGLVLPVRGVEVVKRVNGWQPTIPGTQGRIVQTHTHFTKAPAGVAEQHPGSALVMSTYSVFGPDSSLVGARVSYFLTQPEDGHAGTLLVPVALDKAQRNRVHANVESQLHPNKMRQVR